MDLAKYRPTGDSYLAIDFNALPFEVREKMRVDLECRSCGGEAYFVPTTKRGSTFFGAAHLDGCGEFSGEGGATSVASIPEEDARQLNEDEFKLRPQRPRVQGDHVEHDPTAKPGKGRARRLSEHSSGGLSTPTVGLLSLLTKLETQPAFRSSVKQMRNPRNLKGPVRDQCVNILEAGDDVLNRQRVFWGKVTRAVPNEKFGGSKLFTGREHPTIILTKEMHDSVMWSYGVDDLDELAGASVIFWGFLNESKDGQWRYFMPKQPEWFGLRLVGES